MYEHSEAKFLCSEQHSNSKTTSRYINNGAIYFEHIVYGNRNIPYVQQNLFPLAEQCNYDQKLLGFAQHSEIATSKHINMAAL